jgi:hypothetical protein
MTGSHQMIDQGLYIEPGTGGGIRELIPLDAGDDLGSMVIGLEQVRAAIDGGHGVSFAG